MTKIPQHSCQTDVWYTPHHVIERAREVLGGFDLDPASNAFGNTRVQAARYIDEAENGLTADWGDAKRVFLNPPGGKLNGKSLPALFWRKLMEHVAWRDMRPEFIWIGFSLEQLRVSQGPTVHPFHSMGEFPLCIPEKRLRFVDADGKVQTRPTHSNLIVYNGPKFQLFKKMFGDLGTIIHPE